ncbi:LysR family transcriptional regulator [Eoetvoesiella caeni]
MHIEQLEMTQLRLLEALAQTRNVSVAAEMIGLSQSAASHTLAKLRVLFDDSLFVRTSRGIEPTPFGMKVSAAAIAALKALRHGLEDEGPFDVIRSTRLFNLYMSDVGQMIFLPRLLAEIKRCSPGVTIRVFPVPVRNQSAALESGEIDLAIGHFTSLTTGFFQRRLFRESYVCVARSDHPRFVGGMSAEGFIKAQHATADSSGMAHETIEKELRKHRLNRDVVLTVPQFMVLPLVIESSDILVTMPRGLAEEFAKLISIKVMPTPIKIPSYDIKMYWHQRVHNEDGNKWLRRLFAKLFQENPKKI